jgi:anti-sigma factor RsiW
MIDFDSQFDSSPVSPMNSSSPQSDLHNRQHDRFELLSAYLDGEVTAAERQQVEQWLADDPVVQALHGRLLKLRQGFRALPTPPITQPVEQTVQQVLARVDRRPRLTVLWGGVAAAAAIVLGALTLGFPQGGFSPQMANSPSTSTTATNPTASESEALLVALDQPVLQIPKAAVMQPAMMTDTPEKSGR